MIGTRRALFVLVPILLLVGCSETLHLAPEKLPSVEIVHCDQLLGLEAGCVDVDFRAISLEQLTACDGQFLFLPFGAMHLSSLVGALSLQARTRFMDSSRRTEASDFQTRYGDLQVLGFVDGRLRAYVTRVEGTETTFQMEETDNCEFAATARDMFIRVHGEDVPNTSLSQLVGAANPAVCGWNCPRWSYVAP